MSNDQTPENASGSKTIVTIAISKEGAQRLMEAFKAGQLADLNIIDAHILDEDMSAEFLDDAETPSEQDGFDTQFINDTTAKPGPAPF